MSPFILAEPTTQHWHLFDRIKRKQKIRFNEQSFNVSPPAYQSIFRYSSYTRACLRVGFAKLTSLFDKRHILTISLHILVSAHAEQLIKQEQNDKP